MSIKWLAGSIIVISLGVSGAVTYVVTAFGEKYAPRYLPPYILNDSVAFTHIMLIAQALCLLIAGALVALISYLLFLRLVAQPIRKITEAMQASANGTPMPILSLSYAPSELQTLGTMFLLFSRTMTEAHAHDLETSRVKSDFISTAAHQLRTPLTGIRWALEALEKEPLAEGQQVLVQNAVSKSKDLVSVVGTLLDISSIEAGKYKYTFEQIALLELVANVVRDFQPLAKETGVSLGYEVPTEALPAVRADRERITWVLNNLIENALRYTPREGNVQVSTTRGADRVILEVRDTGIGIAQEDKNNIFERFYRAGNAIAKENKGSGLGLYIARTIATDHGGDLTFAANLNGPGTTFVLALPIIS